MPVLGVVFRLEEPGEGASAGLFRAPDVVLGERTGARWPAVLDLARGSDVERRVDALRALPGVAGIDIVYADFEDALPNPLPEEA